MSRPHETDADWLSLLKQYAIGVGLGGACALYGAVALWMREAFLPGVKTGNSMVTGAHGAGVATAYLAGGLYLFLRFFLHGRCRSESRRAQVYLLENLLLIVLIAAMGYVLWQVGTVG